MLMYSSQLMRMTAIAGMTLLISGLLGCSHQVATPHPQDPYEKYNRAVFVFNKSIDNGLIKPVSYIYWRYLPQPGQSAIGNFFDNLRELPNIGNDFLQAEWAFVTYDTSRFLINSTIGIGGIFDPATSLGLTHRKIDFGFTLYKWGYKQSNYLILPILGPSTVRDAIGILVDYTAFSPWLWIEPEWRYPLLTLDAIDLRARLLRHEAVLNMVAIDEYIFFRNAYFQHREYIFSGEKESESTEIDPYAEFTEDKGKTGTTDAKATKALADEQPSKDKKEAKNALAPKDQQVSKDEHAPKDKKDLKDEHASKDKKDLKDEHASKDKQVSKDDHASKEKPVLKDDKHAPKDKHELKDKKVLKDEQSPKDKNTSREKNLLDDTIEELLERR